MTDTIEHQKRTPEWTNIKRAATLLGWKHYTFEEDGECDNAVSPGGNQYIGDALWVVPELLDALLVEVEELRAENSRLGSILDRWKQSRPLRLMNDKAMEYCDLADVAKQHGDTKERVAFLKVAFSLTDTIVQMLDIEEIKVEPTSSILRESRNSIARKLAEFEPHYQASEALDGAKEKLIRDGK